MKLTDMGTTGLIDYVIGQSTGRRRALAKANAERIIARRYSREAVRRFRQAVMAAEDRKAGR